MKTKFNLLNSWTIAIGSVALMAGATAGIRECARAYDPQKLEEMDKRVAAHNAEHKNDDDGAAIMIVGALNP